MTHRPLFIIPARGGSKGIPYKNIAMLAGKPLIAYTIEAALDVADKERVILSTDDEVIANVGRVYGIDSPHMRPPELATDTAGSREVILDAMAAAEARGIDYDCVVLLQPTSPLRTAADIRGALRLYTPEVDMVVSVCESQANPYYDCFETDAEGYLHVSKGDGTITRRQDAPKAWQYNGAVYVINPESIRREALGRFSGRVPYVMPRERSIDIDSPIDLTIAEALISQTDSSRQTL